MALKKNGKPPRLAGRLLKLMSMYQDRHSIREDFEETFAEIERSKGGLRARCWYWGNALKSLPGYLRRVLSGRGTMFGNYLKVAFRNLKRRRLYAFINIFGLAAGLSICIFITLWIRRELSYDRFHGNMDRIFRVERRIFRDSLFSRWPITGGAYKQALLDDYPEIENAVRVWRREYAVRDHLRFVHRQGFFAVDNSLFDIFDFGLEEGDERTALKKPKKLVLTRRAALKYFGTDDVIGKTLALQWDGEEVDFDVTGILREVPDNSHIHFDALISISSYPDETFSNWRGNYLYTYVLLRENASVRELEKKFLSFVDRRLERNYGDLYGRNSNIPRPLDLRLFPLAGIHLNPSVNWEVEPGGSLHSVYIFATIAVLILLTACINFIHLSTARAGQRAREVGLRKTVGAGLGQLRSQFVLESLLSALISLGLALGLCSMSIPVFNGIMAERLSPVSLFRFDNLAWFAGATLLAGLLSGLYPAFYLTRFDPVGVLKGGAGKGGGKSMFRTGMVVVQFAISSILIFGMFTVYFQMKYVQTRSLGFDKENLVILSGRSRGILQGYDSFRSELRRDPRVLSVSSSADLPGDPFYSNGSFTDPRNPDEPVSLITLYANFDYIETLGMEVLAGRGFSREFGDDDERSFLLNEAAARRFGWTCEEAIGQELSNSELPEPSRVIGVVRDFHFKSLRREVEPAAIRLSEDWLTSIVVRIRPGRLEENLAFIRDKWESVFPGEQFEYDFLDGRIEGLYEKERKARSLFLVFSSLSVLIACLGLFGLAAYTAEVRTKEIGIRKTLGASMGSVSLLLTRDFFKWIFFANLIAWPVAYFTMNEWLRNFAYRIRIGGRIFLLSLSVVLLVSLGTIVYQILKAALADPVDALRYE